MTNLYTSRVPMRTSIEIDDELMATALRETGLRTRRGAVEAALRALIERHRRRRLKDAFGKYPWETISSGCATGTAGNVVIVRSH